MAGESDEDVKGGRQRDGGKRQLDEQSQLDRCRVGQFNAISAICRKLQILILLQLPLQLQVWVIT